MQYDKYTLTKELGAKGVPVGPVLDRNELENDPDLNEDGTVITIDQGDTVDQIKDLAQKGVIGGNDGVKADLVAAPTTD